jgi:hypothetical protein
VGLLSVVCGAAACATVAWLVYTLGTGARPARALGGAAAGLGLGTAPLFWSQATIPEVYTLHVALVCTALALISAERYRTLAGLASLAFVFGLGLTHHPTMALLAAPTGALLFSRDGRSIQPRTLAVAATALLVGLFPVAYLPIRAAADPPLDWGDASHLTGLLWHVTAGDYKSYVGDLTMPTFIGRISAAAALVGGQLTWPGLFVAFVGLTELRQTRPALAWLLVGYGLISVLFAVLYNAEHGQVHLLPVVVVLSVGLGLGVARLAMIRRGSTAALMIGILLWQVGTHFASLDLRSDSEAATYARRALTSAAADSVLRTESDQHTFALWYVQVVEGLRPDVIIVDVRLAEAPWYRSQLERRHPERASRLWPGGGSRGPS